MHTPDFMPVLSAGSHSSPTEGACVMEMVGYLAGEAWSDSPACTHPALARMAQVVNDRLPDSERHLLVPLIGRLFGTAPAGTDHDRHVLSVQLAVWCARRVLQLVPAADDRAVCEVAISTAEAWTRGEATSEDCRAAAAAAYAAVAYAANAAYAAAYANAANAAHAAAYANAANAAHAAAYAAAANAAHAAAYANAANAAHAAAYAAAAAYGSSELVNMLVGLLDEYDRLTGRVEHRQITNADLANLTALTR